MEIGDDLINNIKHSIALHIVTVDGSGTQNGSEKIFKIVEIFVHCVFTI